MRLAWHGIGHDDGPGRVAPVHSQRHDYDAQESVDPVRLVDGRGGEEKRSDQEGSHCSEHHPSYSDAAEHESYNHGAREADGCDWDFLRDGHEWREVAEACLEDEVAYYPDAVTMIVSVESMFDDRSK